MILEHETYLLPGRGVPAKGRSSGGGSARHYLGQLRAWTSVAALLEVQQRFGHISAPPYGEFHVSAQEMTCCQREMTSPTEFSHSEFWLRRQHTNHLAGVFRVSAEVWGKPGQAVKVTYPSFEALSPQRSSLFWKPDPQDLEHWERVHAGGTILENELRVCLRVCFNGNKHKVTFHFCNILPQKCSTEHFSVIILDNQTVSVYFTVFFQNNLAV